MGGAWVHAKGAPRRGREAPLSFWQQESGHPGSCAQAPVPSDEEMYPKSANIPWMVAAASPAAWNSPV